MPKIFIVIPTYNERENIRALVQKIFSLSIKDLSVIIVDDNSPDGTGQTAKKLAEEYPVFVIHRPQKMGLGSAYIQGFKLALQQQADLIFEMDADFSHQPKQIPQFIQAIQEGFEVVLGSRKIAQGRIIGWPWWRSLISWGAMFVSRLVLGLKVKDVTTGFRCYQRKVLVSLDLDKIKSNGYAFLEEMVYLCQKKGFKIKEIPITFLDRSRGKSKLGWKEIIEFFVVLFKLRFLSK